MKTASGNTKLFLKKSFNPDPCIRSGDYGAKHPGPVPDTQSACYGKKNDDNDGEAGLIVRMYHQIEVYDQPLQEGKEGYHQG